MPDATSEFSDTIRTASPECKRQVFDFPSWPPRHGACLAATDAVRTPPTRERHPASVVRENLKTHYAATNDGDAGAALSAFVRKELEGYLDCGLLCRGFAVLACTACHERVSSR